MQLGTAISKIATPIAGALGLGCVDPATNDLRPESRCAQTRAQLDAATNPREFASAIFDRFRSNTNKGDKMVDEIEKKSYTVVILVQTEKLSNIDIKAIETASGGEVLAVNPLQPKPQVQGGGGIIRPANQGQVITRTQGAATSQGSG